MTLKISLALLISLLFYLQWLIWFDSRGVVELWQLHDVLMQQQKENKSLQERNMALDAEVKDLKSGHLAIEERARNDLGMIKQGEQFYLIINEEDKKI